MEKKMILDLGCGRNKHPGSIGIDINTDSDAGIICDFEKTGLPFKDGTFDKVIAKQVLEHVRDVGGLLKEIHRVSRDRARVVIETPHFSCYLAYVDPTHRRSFSIFSFDETAHRCGFDIIMRKITFHKAYRRYGINFLANKFPKGYERFWAFIFPAEHLHFELEVLK